MHLSNGYFDTGSWPSLRCKMNHWHWVTWMTSQWSSNYSFSYITFRLGFKYVFELEIWIEILKSNVFVFEFDLVELYLYLIPKCVFEPNPGCRCWRRSTTASRWVWRGRCQNSSQHWQTAPRSWSRTNGSRTNWTRSSCRPLKVSAVTRHHWPLSSMSSACK